ncbi:MAG: SAM-dependent methyltransferase [Cyclobacteriaceae bacterium]|jgi:SAM-dependent methyltransferase
MYEKLEECPSCKHPQFNNFMICKDFTVSQESFALVKCTKCQLVFTNPRPTIEKITEYYKSENYISHADSATNLVNLIYKLIRKYTLNQKLKHINKYKKGTTIFDFGCGTGHFLNKMKSQKWQISGLEPDSLTRSKASKLLESNIYSSLKEIPKANIFDIITAWHVLEHVHDLRDTLKTLRKKLSTDGYMFIALPNHNSHDAMIYKSFWAGFDVPRHLYHFDIDSFQRLAKSQKLNLVDTIPMKFDSYYVSLLSEKYKTGHSKYIKSIRNGYNSNQYAAHSNGEYSSLIYVLSK